MSAEERRKLATAPLPPIRTIPGKSWGGCGTHSAGKKPSLSQLDEGYNEGRN